MEPKIETQTDVAAPATPTVPVSTGVHGRSRVLFLYRKTPDGRKIRYRFEVSADGTILSETPMGEAGTATAAARSGPSGGAAVNQPPAPSKELLEKHMQGLRQRGFVVEPTDDGRKILIKHTPNEERLAQLLMSGKPVDFQDWEKWAAEFKSLMSDAQERKAAGKCTNCEMGRIRDKFRERLVHHLKTLNITPSEKQPPDTRAGEAS